VEAEMTKTRKQYSELFKFKVAMEAIKGLTTINELASQYQVHPNQVRNWKKKLTEDGPMVFEGKSRKHHQNLGTEEAELYEQIGRLKMELEWLKKKVTSIN
jgi:putative transposase